MSRQHAIVIEGLIKFYGPVQALYGVDLEVRRGGVFGFLGPNGAGKTTTIRCMLDLIHPNGGSIRVLGLNPQADPVAVRARTGYLPGELHLDETLTVEATLRFLNDLRGGKADWAFVRRLAERLDLDLQQPVKNLSKGNKQKVGLIQALMHRPELLLLDEPTASLDPLMQHEVLRLITEARDAGATIFFSSHHIGEVEMIAFFGNVETIATPEGYLSVEMFSYMPLVLGIFAILAGSGLLVGDEEKGTLDLILAHPVSRTDLFVGRLLAFVTTTVAILALMWLGLVTAGIWSPLGVGVGRLILPFLSLLAILLLFGTLALLLSMLLPARRLAAMGAGILLVGNFFLVGLANINDDLKPIARLTPLHYYQSGEAIGGLNGRWIVGLLAVAVLFALLAWWRFRQRDIRVVGEGGWQVRTRLARLRPPWRKLRVTEKGTG